MKRAIALGCLAITTGSLSADPLSSVDRMELIERLDALRGEAREKALSRFDGANAAFAEGMKSNEAATALYLNCIEKVDFTDQDRKSSDFRDWRKRNKDRLSEESHALALRHQLRWTVLSMRAAGNPEKKLELAAEALGMLQAIYDAPLELRPHTRLLSTSVSHTIFARAYGLSGYKIPEWPMSPIANTQQGLLVDGPFVKLIFPAYRKAGNFPALRAAWEKRIDFEEIATGFWSGEAPEKKNPGVSEARDTFLLEKVPSLRWQMEADLFASGDEKIAALNMLKHLAENISHTDARDWEAQFREMVNPTTEEG